MKKTDPIGNQEFEKILKEKMDGLSANVDCFDKISARAFPDKSEDFSDSELTVSELENITGKRRPVPVLKWVSAAAALVLIIGILPKTVMMSNLKQKLMHKQDKKIYRDLISEIKSETENGGYTILDIPLEEYIENDVLITPFYCCPFKSSDKKDMNVRIYIRMAGGIQTNQIYAVEYCGEYSESGIVAAAKSKAEFSDREIEKLEAREISAPDRTKNLYTVSDIFSSDGENLTDSSGDSISAAGFCGTSFYKDSSDIITVNYNVLYYHKDINENGSYFYDIDTSCTIDGSYDSTYIIPENEWKCSVNYNDKDAMPESSGSSFTKQELYSDTPSGKTSTVLSIMPFFSDVSKDILSDNGKLEMYLADSEHLTTSDKLITELSVPAEEILRQNTSVFFSSGLSRIKDLDSIVIIAGSPDSSSKQMIFHYDSFITQENIMDAMTQEEISAQYDSMQELITQNRDKLSEAQLEQTQQYMSRLQEAQRQADEEAQRQAEGAQRQAEGAQRQAEEEKANRRQAEDEKENQRQAEAARLHDSE